MEGQKKCITIVDNNSCLTVDVDLPGEVFIKVSNTKEGKKIEIKSINNQSSRKNKNINDDNNNDKEELKEYIKTAKEDVSDILGDMLLVSNCVDHLKLDASQIGKVIKTNISSFKNQINQMNNLLNEMKTQLQEEKQMKNDNNGKGKNKGDNINTVVTPNKKKRCNETTRNPMEHMRPWIPRNPKKKKENYMLSDDDVEENI